MPVPTITGLPPNPTPEDMQRKINTLVQDLRELFLTLDSLNVVSLTADNIDAGTLNAAIVTVKAALTGLAYIQLSSAGMVINDGTKNVFTADTNGLLTIISALIQSATGYPRVELNSTANLIGAYQDANNAVRVVTSYSSGKPAVTFYSGGSVVGYLQDLSPILAFLTITGQRDLQIGSGKTLYLTANNGIEMQGTSLKMNNQTGYNGSFVAGTKTVTVVNGIITSVV